MSSPNTVCYRKLLGNVASKVKASYGHISAIPASSNTDYFFEIEQFEDGSHFGMSTSQQILKPLPENDLQLHSCDRGMFVYHIVKYQNRQYLQCSYMYYFIKYNYLKL